MTCSRYSALRTILLASAIVIPTSAMAEDNGAKALSELFAPGAVAAGDVVPMTRAEMSKARGAGLLDDLISLLDEGNTVSVTVDDNPTQTSTGDDPQFISISNGNINVSTGASTLPVPGGTTGGTSFSSSFSSTTRVTTHSSSSSIGF